MHAPLRPATSARSPQNAQVDGCNHVLCAPPLGCGESFCFLCLQPHKTHDPRKCGGGAQADANMRAHDPAREAEMMRRHARQLQQQARAQQRPRAGPAAAAAAAAAARPRPRRRGAADLRAAAAAPDEGVMGGIIGGLHARLAGVGEWAAELF